MRLCRVLGHRWDSGALFIDERRVVFTCDRCPAQTSSILYGWPGEPHYRLPRRWSARPEQTPHLPTPMATAEQWARERDEGLRR